MTVTGALLKDDAFPESGQDALLEGAWASAVEDWGDKDGLLDATDGTWKMVSCFQK